MRGARIASRWRIDPLSAASKQLANIEQRQHAKHRKESCGHGAHDAKRKRGGRLHHRAAWPGRWRASSQEWFLPPPPSPHRNEQRAPPWRSAFYRPSPPGRMQQPSFRTRRTERVRCAVIGLVRDHHPPCRRDEGEPYHRAHHHGTCFGRDPGIREARQRVIGQRCCKDAEDDGNGPLELCGK